MSDTTRPPATFGRGALSVPRSALVLPAGAILALAAGSAAWAVDRGLAHRVWDAGLVLTGAPVVWRTLRGMLRGEFAADVVAMLAIVTAVALHQPMAGLVIVLMQTGGELLDRYAEGRASEAVRALEAEAPHTAHRLGTDGHAEDIAAEAIAVGDRLLVRPGEMLPCDGTVVEGRSHLDVSRLTGEAPPELVQAGSEVRSGAVNLEGPVVVQAAKVAAESLYARIVELVRRAQAEKSPTQRLADRWAVWFTPLTLAVCAAAYAASHDPLRVLAVLVVATPCPLILATPVAIIGGINRAARRQVIIRTGSGLERLGSVDTAVFDKTGTLTIGRPQVVAVDAAPGFDRATVLRLAAAVEGGSGHLLARTTVEAARRDGLSWTPATGIVEHAGLGVEGTAEGHAVLVGSAAWATRRHPEAAAAVRALHDGGLRAVVLVDGQAAGTIEYADRAREGLSGFFADLGRLGIRRTVLLSGDHAANVASIARALGITEARGDLLPEDKVSAVRALMAEGRHVVMVGDGTNDAPALSAATVGIALAAHGGGITAEAADAVVLCDDVTRVADAIRAGRRAVGIARQSIGVGLGLSLAAMVAAAFGQIPPAVGALLQEGIDVAVILNALRAAQDG